MGSLVQDLTYAFRAMGRRPATHIAAVLMLALGVGATTAIFSILNGVVLRPLPFSQPEELVTLRSERQGSLGSLSGPEFELLRDSASAYSQLASTVQMDLNLTGSGPPERLLGAQATANLPSLLGVEPILGRVFSAQEATPGRDGVALISEALWRQRFSGDEEVLGKKLLLDGKSHLVIGVLPSRFSFPEPTVQVWVPLVFTGDALTNVGTHMLEVVGRLRPGVSPEAASEEATALLATILTESPLEHRPHAVHLAPLHEELVGEVRPGLTLLLGAVAAVLLITCVNLGNLQLVQAERRRRELALRAALGAGRPRLVRQLLTEHLLVGLLGGAVGILWAMWAEDFLVALAPPDLPRIDSVSLDGTVLIFGLIISLGAGLILGLLPALEASRVDPQSGIREKAGNVAGRSGRKALITAEIALSLLLLVCSGLLIRSFFSLTRVDLGFDPVGVTAARVSLPEERYPFGDAMTRLVDDVLEELRAQPGVESAAAMMPLPFSGERVRLSAEFTDGRPRPEQAESPNWCNVTPEVFSVLRIPLLRGRLLEGRDGAPEAPPVMVINETMARRYFPAEEAVGKEMILGYDDLRFEIVGVVGDLRLSRLDQEPRSAVYTPFGRTPWPSFSFLTRLEPDAAGLVGTEALLRGAVSSVDPELPIYGAAGLQELIHRSLASRRYVLALVVSFSLTALLLAAVGIFAVVSFSVGRRTREIGIRKALGAKRSEVLSKVVKDGLRPVTLGIVVGLAAALLSLRLIESQLFGVRAEDPVTLGGVALLLLLVALAATYLPARRAAGIDPMTALRHE